MVGNLNRRSKRIEFIKEQNMLSEDTGENNCKVNEDLMNSSVTDLFKNVRYYSSGILEEKVSLALEMGQAMLCPYLSPFCDYYIIGKDPEIEETIDLDVPVVLQDWVVGSVECGQLLPPAAFSPSPSQDELMSGVRVCISGVSRPDACSIWTMVKFNGGQVDTKLTAATTHLVATSDQGKLYEEALARSDVFVVTPDWVTDSVRRKIKCIEDLYHPRLLDTSGINLIDTPQIAPTDQHSDASEIKTVSEPTVIEDYNPEPTPPATNLGATRRSNLTWFANLFSMSSERTSPKKMVRFENKREDENKFKQMRKIEGKKKLIPVRCGRVRPKASESKLSLKKEKAGENSTRIKKAVIKRAIQGKAGEAKNPTIQQRMTRKQSIIGALLVNPETQELASQCPINQIKSIPKSDNQTTQTQDATLSHCLPTSPNLMDPSTMMPSNDYFQRSEAKKPKQEKPNSSVKRKLAKKENIGKVSKKLKRRNISISRLSENLRSIEDYCCQMCDKAFRKKWKLLVHNETVHEAIRFPCAMCGRTASTKSNLKRHMAMKHNVHKHDIVNDDVKVDDSINKDVKEDTDTSHPDTISSPEIANTSHDSLHTLQLAEEKQNLKSSNCTQNVQNSPQGDDLKHQKCAPGQPSKHHQAATNSQPVLSLSVHDVQHVTLPHLQSKLLLASVQTTPGDMEEVSPLVRSWSVEETITYISLFDPKLAPHVQIFRSHDIDGRALLLLTPDMKVEYLNMKLGPALKVGLIIEKYKRK